MLPTFNVQFGSVIGDGVYEVAVYENVLGTRCTIYEIYKPLTALPWSFVLDAHTADIKIFHDLVGCDDFDRDNYFIGRLWVWLHNSPFRRGDLDISLDEEDEPKVFRRNADDLIFNMEQVKLTKLMMTAMGDESFVGR
jgi:hypothetical protein